MKKYFLVTWILLMGWMCQAQPMQHKLLLQIPTIQQEASSIWRTIYDIAFFEKQNYTINLPDAPLIDQLIAKSKAGTFGNEDFSSIYQLLEDGAYQKEDYKPAYEKVVARQDLLLDAIQQLDSMRNCCLDWDFYMPPTYEVVLTLYGSGGSYDPESGVITLFMTKEGTFKRYLDPAPTLVHEMVHIGLEKTIVEKYQLPHQEKERLVDLFVSLMFGDVLPQYKVQDFGALALDPLIKDQEALLNLGTIIEDYVKEKR
ncbi:MAG: hypothetical protein AAFQ83_17310 [Bacteroidota bacterium]